ncbi:oligosaccharide flippase family protein [Halosimplex halobium]|uniref:oligosaccharide flippase family protein n=1 Tax=Halosimplex halobium TaxID=3396618 RepID=UPI003F578334
MNLRKVATDSAVSGLRTVLSIVRGIAVIAIITNELNAEAYAAWVSAFAVVSLVGSIGALHLHGALIRYRPKDAYSETVFADVLCLALGAATLVTAGLVGLGSIVPLSSLVDGADDLFAPVVSLVAITVVSKPIFNYPRSVEHVKIYELLVGLRLIGEIVGIAVSIYIYESLTLALWSVFAVIALLSLTILVGYRPVRGLPSPSNFRTYLTYSLPMVPKGVGSKLLTDADKLLLLYFLTPNHVAVYAVAYSLASQLGNLTAPLNSTLYPTVISAWERDNKTELRSLYTSILRGTVLIGIPAAVGLSILSRPLLTLMSTSDLASKAYLYVPILSLGFLSQALDEPLRYLVNAANENQKLAVITVTSAACNIVLNVVLIPLIGIQGSVLATIASQIVITVYLSVYAVRTIQVSFSLGIVSAAVQGTAVMVVVLMVLPVGGVVDRVVLFPIIGVGVYIASLLFLGTISVHDLQAFKSTFME